MSTRIFSDAVPVAFVDIETTGGQASLHRITEIAIVAARGDAFEYEWSTLVNPGVSIPYSITQLTGIDNDMVQDAPAFEDIARELRERLAGRLFIAHNVRFDYHFIRGEFQRLGDRWQARTACTARLSRRLFPEQRRHNLDTLIEVHGFECAHRHRALADAQVLWQFWRKLQRERSLPELDAALDEVARTVALPPHLSPDLIDDLPEQAGVYRFFGGNDALIYIGKANNLRERVLEHFAGAHRDEKSRRLTEQTQRIEWTCTAGELGALLLEAREVRERKPVYNRKLRNSAIYSWQWPDDAAAPSVIAQDESEPSKGAGTGASRYGLFKTERAAQRALRALADEHRLCVKLLGLERGQGSCFAYQLGRCRGACVGVEPPALHAVRARLAMARWKLKDWPYAGPIAVLERSANGRLDAHLIEDWVHRATLELAPEDEALADGEFTSRCRQLLARSVCGEFHSDTYRILSSWVGKSAVGREILQLGDTGSASGTMPE